MYTGIGYGLWTCSEKMSMDVIEICYIVRCENPCVEIQNGKNVKMVYSVSLSLTKS